MKNKKKVFILLLIIIIVTIFYKCKKYETFSKKIYYKNIFKTKIFDNKDIFLIANVTEDNFSKETINFLNNYNYDNSFVIRFRNDPNNLVSKICINKTDMMVYRAILQNNIIIGYHGFTNKNNHIKYNVFTYTEPNLNKQDTDKTSYDLTSNISKMHKRKDHPPFVQSLQKLKYDKYVAITDWFGNKEHTTGFSILKNIVENTKYRKIYLVGYSNLSGDCTKKKVNTWHTVIEECKYFEKHFKKNNIKILL